MVTIAYQNNKKIILIVFFLLVSCKTEPTKTETILRNQVYPYNFSYESSSDSKPNMTWELIKTNRVLVNRASCKDELLIGVYWETMSQQVRTISVSEEMWLASIKTTKNINLDYKSNRHNGSYVRKTGPNNYLIYDSPTRIINMLSTKCEISFFDLTAFPCDCDEALCQKARTCQLAYSMVWTGNEQRTNRNNILNFGVIGCYRGPGTLQQDVFFERAKQGESNQLNLPTETNLDHRGVFWLDAKTSYWGGGKCNIKE